MNKYPFNRHEAAQNLIKIAHDLRILLVEDEPAIQLQLKTLLSRFFPRIDTANNGIEALDMYEQHPYDVILTDLTMPNMGGIELSSTIRAIETEQKIIVISAHSESEKLVELINIGVDGFILKPINVDHVIQILSKTCQAVYDRQMYRYMNTLLEKTNQELKASNIELEWALNRLQITRELYEQSSNSTIKKAQKNQETDRFYEMHPSHELEKTNSAFEKIEDNFNLLLIGSERRGYGEIISDMNRFLKEYIDEMSVFGEFYSLKEALEILSVNLGKISSPSEKLSSLYTSLIGLFDTLEQWRRGVFIYQNIDEIEMMDEHLIRKISDLETLITQYK